MRRIVSPLVTSLVAILFLCQCDDKGAAIKIKGLRDEIDALAQQNAKAEDERRRLEQTIDTIKLDKKKLDDDKAKAEADRVAAEKQLQDLKADFERYKVQYKLSMKQRAPGMKIDNFTTVEGKNYSDVVLKEITDAGIYFMHSGGIMRLEAKQLPSPMQLMLGLLTDTPSEQPRQTLAISSNQLLLKHRAERDLSLQAATAKIDTMRRERMKLQERVKNTKEEIRLAKLEGRIVPVIENRLATEQLAESTLQSQILQAEVDAEALRKSPLPTSSVSR